MQHLSGSEAARPEARSSHPARGATLHPHPAATRAQPRGTGNIGGREAGNDGARELLQRCAVVAVAAGQIAVLGLATPPATLANTADFTIDVRPSERDPESEYFQTVPQGLSSGDSSPKGPRLGSLLQGPKGKEVQQCARKCVPTCIRGGQGAPGLGPMSVRKELVVFKEGYRTRAYCLSECIQVCSLTLNPAAAPATAAAKAPE